MKYTEHSSCFTTTSKFSTVRNQPHGPVLVYLPNQLYFFPFSYIFPANIKPRIPTQWTKQKQYFPLIDMLTQLKVIISADFYKVSKNKF